MMFQTLGRIMDEASVLRLECEDCGHVATWSRQVAIERLGADASPFEIRRKVRCSACGGRKVTASV